MLNERLHGRRDRVGQPKSYVTAACEVGARPTGALSAIKRPILIRARFFTCFQRFKEPNWKRPFFHTTNLHHYTTCNLSVRCLCSARGETERVLA